MNDSGYNGPDPNPDRDLDLRARFARLRQEERAAAPAFRPPRLGGERLRAAPAVRWRLAGALAAGLILALVGGWVVRRGLAPVGGAPQPALAAWRSPTDFLLDTSNRELFTGQPKLGAIRPLPFTERSTAP